MSLVKWGFIGLFLLPVAEMAAFVAVAITIGWFWAVVPFSGHDDSGPPDPAAIGPQRP